MLSLCRPSIIQNPPLVHSISEGFGVCVCGFCRPLIAFTYCIMQTRAPRTHTESIMMHAHMHTTHAHTRLILSAVVTIFVNVACVFVNIVPSDMIESYKQRCDRIIAGERECFTRIRESCSTLNVHGKVLHRMSCVSPSHHQSRFSACVCLSSYIIARLSGYISRKYFEK